MVSQNLHVTFRVNEVAEIEDKNFPWRINRNIKIKLSSRQAQDQPFHLTQC